MEDVFSCITASLFSQYDDYILEIKQIILVVWPQYVIVRLTEGMTEITVLKMFSVIYKNKNKKLAKTTAREKNFKNWKEQILFLQKKQTFFFKLGFYF